MKNPWGEFLKARHKLIHYWAKEEGKTPEQITKDLNHHDVGQIRLLLATPLQSESN